MILFQYNICRISAGLFKSPCMLTKHVNNGSPCMLTKQWIYILYYNSNTNVSALHPKSLGPPPPC